MQLEHSAYEWQLKIFETQIDILTEEEQRVRFAIDNIKQQRAGLFENVSVVYYCMQDRSDTPHVLLFILHILLFRVWTTTMLHRLPA